MYNDIENHMVIGYDDDYDAEYDAYCVRRRKKRMAQELKKIEVCEQAVDHGDLVVKYTILLDKTAFKSITQHFDDGNDLMYIEFLKRAIEGACAMFVHDNGRFFPDSLIKKLQNVKITKEEGEGLKVQSFAGADVDKVIRHTITAAIRLHKYFDAEKHMPVARASETFQIKED